MRKELRDYMSRCNANARQARADGRWVSLGQVYDHEPAIDEVLCRPLCAVGDYGEWKAAHGRE